MCGDGNRKGRTTARYIIVKTGTRGLKEVDGVRGIRIDRVMRGR